MHRTPRWATLLVSVAAAMSFSPLALAQEPPRTGVYLEAAAALSMHKDTVGLRGTDAADGYFNLGASLRLGASLSGLLVGVSAERAAMIDTEGASYFSVFAGDGFQLPNGKRLELAGELGWHGFENVGARGNEDVTSENHVFLPFLGGRVTLTEQRPASRWQQGLFLQVRHDLRQGQVTSNRTMTCSSGVADAPVCTPGDTSTGYFQVGGLSVEIGLELRPVF